METCVVIPRCLAIMLRPFGGGLDMGVTLWTKMDLPPGTTLTAGQGEARLDRLDINSKLPAKDVRCKFGGYDEVFEVDERPVRHCNWVRFLCRAQSLDEVNVVATKIKGLPVFQIVKYVETNTELKVFFDCDEEEEVEEVEEVVEDIVEEEEDEEIDVEDDEDVIVDDISDTEGPQPKRQRIDCGDEIPTHDEVNQVNTVTSSRLTSPCPVSLPSPIPLTLTRCLNSTSVSPPLTHTAMSEHPSKRMTSLSPLPTRMTSLFSSPGDRPSREPHFSPASDVSNDSRGSSNSSLKVESPRDADGNMSSPASSLAFSPPSFTSPPSDPSMGLVSPPGGSLGQSPALGMQQYPARRREKTWLPCEVCGKKFDRPSLLKRHTRTHTGEKPHACDVCGKAFSTSSSLNTHRRIHSGEKPHECQVCGKRFTASSNLYYHRMTHRKEKPHKCTLCCKSFPTPGDLKSHMYVHSGSWPFRCDICSRGFSKQTNLKNHMLLHTGDKPHTCDVCGKKFALQCNLKTHLKTHEEESRGDQCMRCHRPLSAVKPGQQGSPLCGDCQKSPLGKHLSPFSVESLVSPRKEEVEKSSQSHIPTSEPVGTSPMGVSPPQRDGIRHPYYASAMMSAGYFPMHGASTPANMMQYSMQRGMWPPAAPLTSHYRV